MSVVLGAESLSVRFGGVLALDEVDLSVSDGEVIGVVGANGAGKTTLLDCLSGQTRPVSGRVWMNGVDISRLGPQRRARRGVIRSFHDARLFPTLSVQDALLLSEDRAFRTPWVPSLPGGRGWSRRRQQRLAGARDLAARMRLELLLGRAVGELSTGDRKRLALACALGLRARVLLLDEPSAGLGAAEVPALGELLRGAAQAGGAGVVMVEHDLPLVWSLADRVVVMDNGKVVAAGPPASLRGHPALAFGRLG